MEVRDVDPDAPEEEIFRADAKAEGIVSCSAGRECAGGASPKDAFWFFLELTRRGSP